MTSNFGKSFIDKFQSNNKESAVTQPVSLSKKMGVNKKKTTALQQNIISVIQQTQMSMMPGA